MAFKNYYGNVVSQNTSGEVSFDDLNSVLSIWERPQYDGYINASGNWSYVGTGKYNFAFLKVKAGDVFNTGGDYYRIAVVSELSTPVNNASANVIENGIVSSNKDYVVPEGAKYIGICTLSNGSVTTDKHLYINNIDFIKTAREELRSEKFDNGVNWVQFGDSITSGYYSYYDDDGNPASKASGTTIVYPYKVGKINHWNYTNMGYGGMGWIMTSSGAAYQAYNRIKEVDLTQYNLVTFAYGINDWKGNKVMGSLNDQFTFDVDMVPASVIESMRYCIEYVMQQNPHCKIIVITPFNCCGYGFDFGTKETNWGRGYAWSNTGTLDEFADKMIEVCNYYGIQYIDMTRYSCINRANLRDLLIDGVHPSEACHALLARDLAKKITFA